MVDEDVDVLNWYEVGLAVGARYTPETATEIFAGRGMPLDPSSKAEDRYASSKLVIDATKQWPEEGGPAPRQCPQMDPALRSAGARDQTVSASQAPRRGDVRP